MDPVVVEVVAGLLRGGAAAVQTIAFLMNDDPKKLEERIAEARKQMHKAIDVGPVQAEQSTALEAAIAGKAEPSE